MQIHCQQCHKPFALGKDAVHQALDLLFAEDLHHYNAQCPHCRRINRVPRADLLRATPGYVKKEATPAED